MGNWTPRTQRLPEIKVVKTIYIYISKGKVEVAYGPEPTRIRGLITSLDIHPVIRIIQKFWQIKLHKIDSGGLIMLA